MKIFFEIFTCMKSGSPDIRNFEYDRMALKKLKIAEPKIYVFPWIIDMKIQAYTVKF